MPIFRANGRMHYFAHVPKCGGSSVESYLESRFGPLSLTFHTHDPRPPRHFDERWYKSAPQHLDASSLAELFPADWIASSFAVVRHPFTRLASAWRYHLGRVHAGEASVARISWWFEKHTSGGYTTHSAIHNHLKPQADLVPVDATVFRLEEGLDRIVTHLDHLAGDNQPPRAMPHENRADACIEATSQDLIPADLLARAARYYAEDFERFGYDPAHHRDLTIPYLPIGRDGYAAEIRVRTRRGIKRALRAII